MEAGGAKGTVTPLSSLFPAEDAHKAAKIVQNAISEKQTELRQLQGYISDNSDLIHLVQKLPEELYHEVMVPFGKAAFFPGRLIHTNEFMVLLGEGYYADRTSTQTVEILKRRGNALDSQVDSLKAMMDNLRAQASFFDTTASEAEEGLVEIKEEYVEESSREQESESGVNKPDVPGVDKAKIAEEDNEEYARIMSRLEELEKEEELATTAHGVDKENTVDEVEYARIMSRLAELEKEEELAAANGNQSDEEDEEEKETSNLSVEKFHDDKHSFSKPSSSTFQPGSSAFSPSSSSWLREEIISKERSSLLVQSSSKDDTSSGNNSLAQTRPLHNPNSATKSVTFAEVKETNQTWAPSTTEAFTGSIIERPPIIPRPKQETELFLPSDSQHSRPRSRFMTKRR